MDDVVLRGIVVATVVVGALLVGRLVARWQRPTHPPVDLSMLEIEPGIVAFTSTECDNCKRVMGLLRDVDIPVREITNDLEPGQFAVAGVEAVPLVVVTDRSGNVVRQLAGVPTRAALTRAISAAGW